MNNYQKAEAWIKEIDDNPDWGHTEIDWEAIDQLKELIEKEERHRWHDLRKNPNDLPEGRDWVLAVFKEPDTDFVLVPRVAEYIGRPTKVTTNDNWIILDSYNGDMTLNPYYANLVCIGWKDIEEFEDE